MIKMSSRRSTVTKSKTDLFFLPTFCFAGSHANDFEHRLMEHLFKGYNKDSRPVFNKSEAVNVELDVAYSQLVDLVGPLYCFCNLILALK